MNTELPSHLLNELQTQALSLAHPSGQIKETTNFSNEYHFAKEDDNTRLIHVSLSQLSPMSNQPRKQFDEGALKDLAASILAHGILQPIIVTEDRNHKNRYTIIAGERRYRASKMLGLNSVPIIVKQVSHDLQLELALIENIQREELNPMEEAEAIYRLITDHGYTHEQLAKRLGKDRTTISNNLRLLTLPPEVQTDLREKRISAGHGKALCAIESKKQQIKMRDAILSKKLSVRKTEEMIKALKKSKDSHKVLHDKITADLRHLCEELKSCLQLKVRISGNNDQGKIELEYFSADDLERLSRLLLGDLFELERGNLER